MEQERRPTNDPAEGRREDEGGPSVTGEEMTEDEGTTAPREEGGGPYDSEFEDGSGSTVPSGQMDAESVRTNEDGELEVTDASDRVH